MNPITYLSDQPAEYMKELDKAETLEDLKRLMNEWEPLAWDAKDIVRDMDEARFAAFRKALKSERRGKFSGNKDAAVILMPEVMFKVSIIANKFFAPWGCAFKRMQDEGLILQGASGRFYIKEKK